MTDVAEFVATHFADTRIIIAETKDILTQALSSFICNRTMLTALEEMPEASQVTMVKAILRPYENRAWAQSNWMLVCFEYNQRNICICNELGTISKKQIT